MTSLVWVGIRESDLLFQTFIDRSVTMFGTNSKSNVSYDKEVGLRSNYNDPMFEKCWYRFMNDKVERFLNDDPSCKFIFYDNLDVVELPSEFHEHIIGKNENLILDLLYNKMYVRAWLQNGVPILPYYTLLGSEFDYETALVRLGCREKQKIVIQGVHSTGGYNTLLFSAENEESNINKLNANGLYAACAYLEESIPINVHTVIYQDEFVFFPGSIQILSTHDYLGYKGSDYTAFGQLDSKHYVAITETLSYVCEKLRLSGYRGICGIDLLLHKDTAYLAEINARFQSSTPILSRILFDNNCPSIFEYHLSAFDETSCNYPKLELSGGNGSIYSYTYSDNCIKELEWLHLHVSSSRSESIKLIDDGLDWSCDMEEGTYLFKLIFQNNISFVTPQNKLRLHTNLHHPHPTPSVAPDKDTLLDLKIRLLCHGVTINGCAANALSKMNGYDYEEFYAITIRLCNDVWVSVPSSECMHEISPYCIDVTNSGEICITHYGKRVLTVSVQPEDRIAKRYTSSGHKYNDIAYMGVDRLRIYHKSSCAFRDSGNECAFCDLIGTRREINFSIIKEVIDDYMEAYPIKHCMIGGGSGVMGNESAFISRISSYINARYQRPIYVMCLPITKLDELVELKHSGVTEIAFNLEICNRRLAERLMPGKGLIPFPVYIEALQRAVQVFGANGQVRSALLVGIDTEADLYETVSALCQIGVAPILSYLRPIEHGTFKHYVGPSADKIKQIYLKSEAICQSYNLSLGPSCKICQNNTLQLSL